MAGGDEIDPGYDMLALKEWARQQRQLYEQLQPIATDLQRQYAAIADSMRLALAPILDDLKFPQAVFAKEFLAALRMPQLSVEAELLRRVVTPANSVIAEALESLRWQGPAMTEVQDQMRDWMQDSHAALRDALKPLNALIKGIGKGKEIKVAFESARLWLAPSMPRQLVSRILELHRAGASPRVIASVVSRYYARDRWALLATAVERWGKNPLFKGRMPIFRHALEAHRTGWFTLTVPSLVAQVEGICGKHVKRRKLLPKLTGRTKKVVQTALESAPCSLADVERYAALDGVLTFIEHHFYAVKDFDTEYGSLIRDKNLTAHAIRHGHQPRYDTRMNSLRLFLLLDVLSLLN